MGDENKSASQENQASVPENTAINKPAVPDSAIDHDTIEEHAAPLPTFIPVEDERPTESGGSQDVTPAGEDNQGENAAGGDAEKE